MARLGDVPKLLKSVGLLEFARRVWHQVQEDNLFTWAAALAYSWLFAVFPFVLFLLSLIPYLPGQLREDTARNVPRFLTSWLPHEAAQTLIENFKVEEHVKEFLNQQRRNFVMYAGLLIALWAASGGMSATMSALDKCYELDRGRPYYRQRLLAIAMTILVMFLLLLVVCLLPVGSLAKDWVIAHNQIARDNPILIVFNIVRWILALVFMFGVLAIVYYKGPSIKHHFHWITPGAAFSVVVWLLLGVGFRIYMDRMGDKGVTLHPSATFSTGSGGRVPVFRKVFKASARVWVASSPRSFKVR